MTAAIHFGFDDKPDPEFLSACADFLANDVFETFNSEDFLKVCRSQPDITCHWAKEDQKIVGLKIGYPKDSEQFYSWLGGVASSFRGRGVGKQLMINQEAWARSSGFKVVTLKTMNRWLSMLLMSLKNGYEIIGTEVNPSGELKILLSKKIG
jgi:GNAT superfamily N-acetyltransferase